MKRSNYNKYRHLTKRLHRGIVIVSLGRNPGEDVVARAGIAADECEAGIAAAQLARDGVNHAIAGSMDRMKLNFI